MKDSRMRDEDGFLTEHDPEPKFPLRPPEEDIESGRCGRCAENVSFTDGRSDCCGWPLLELPEE